MKIRNERGFTVVEIIAVLGALAGIGLAIFGLYVVIHFIMKFW